MLCILRNIITQYLDLNLGTEFTLSPYETQSNKVCIQLRVVKGVALLLLYIGYIYIYIYIYILTILFKGGIECFTSGVVATPVTY